MAGRRPVTILAFAVALACTMAPPAAPTLAAQSTQTEVVGPALVTVTGEAEVRVVPDEVVLTLGVETWDQSLGRAKQANDAAVQRLLALAAESGIAPQHVQTDYVSIEPRYRDDYDKKNFIGYFVRKNVVVTLKDLGLYEEFLSEALEAGANYVHGVEFRTTELRKQRDRARSLAIRAAREKAEALAGELGKEIREPYRITEEGGGWWSPYGAWWGGRWGSATQNVVQETGSAPALTDESMTLAPGQISVTARVGVSFELK